MSTKESKPNLSDSQVTEIIKRLYGLTVSIIRPLPSYDDQNFYVAPSEGGEYVLKVMNSADSHNSTVIELQTHSMNFLHQRGLPAQTAFPTLTGQLMSLEEFDCGFGLQKYLVRLLAYLPGTTIAEITCSPQILYDVGKMAATLDTVLLQMEHPKISSLQRENFIWSLTSVPLLNQYLHVMDGDPVQKVVKSVIEQYQVQVMPKLPLFRKCINHGDFNDHNLLVKPDGPSKYKISGILDFGDMSCGYFIFELAITIMYMMIENPNPLDVGGPVVAGWESVFPLNEAERDSLYLLVLCRFCQSLVLARHTVIQQPENKEYLMITARTGVRHLSRLWELGKEEVERVWSQSAAQFSQP
ncbi:hydroxylysine kinase isoform X2 [Pimephales promelas]|uniref:hydroxylysine kinase isoform X2 n=1 Tax=Pimephales promelas TaxID=90988 RepID=UPI001955CA0A|nr:hydroxylysine kinase isoform X2 [Pimephales promelas]KAG1927245.1 hydroxylysine kinase [Pimephales promelas]